MDHPAGMVEVKYKTVTIRVFPCKHPKGDDYHRFTDRDGKLVTRSTLAKAKAAALKHAQLTYAGQIDLATLTPEQNRAVKRMIEADPSCNLVDEFLLWHSRRAPRKNSTEAIAEFLAVKEANRGRSSHNLEILTRHLKKLPDANLADIRVTDLPEIPGAARTKVNVINAWITFFRWCVVREYLPRGEKTAPERLEKPIVLRSIPATWTPAELETLLADVRPEYLGWLACGNLAGIRTEELCPAPSSDKSPLDWSDFQWERDLIIVRPETDKNGHRRVVPILPRLRAILWPLRRPSGRIGPVLPPHTPPKGGIMAETTRLGACVGGWRRNANRHSFISYRAAQVGIAQAAMEAGNSESEAKKSYNDSKGRDEADAFLGKVTPKSLPEGDPP